MAGLDGPRALSPALRGRLAQALSAQIPSPARPLDDALSARLEDTLADPLAGALGAALAGAASPRPLTPTARRRIEKALAAGTGRRPRHPAVAVAAGLLALAGVGLGLGLAAAGGAGAPGRAALPTVAPTSPLSATGRAPSGSSPAQPSAQVQPAAPPGPAAQGGSAAAQAGPASATATPAVPQIEAVEPPVGPLAGGNWVTVTGSGLSGATAVEFGTTRALFAVVSDGELRVQAPAHSAGTVDVRVTTPGGTSTPGPADTYRYS